MPLLQVYTNQEFTTTEGRADFLRAASTDIARLLDKPEKACMVTLETNRDILFAGSDNPAAFVELASLGLPSGETGHLSAGLCDLLSEHLGVHPARIFIHFHDVEQSMWGNNRTTFA